MLTGATVTGEITSLLKARNHLLWVVSREETRAERAITTAAGAARYATRYWDCATGITEIGPVVNGAPSTKVLVASPDPSDALRFIRDNGDRAVYVMRDFHAWLDQMTRRQVKTLVRALQTVASDKAKAIVVLSASNDVPSEWSGVATVVEYPLPDRAEIGEILDATLSRLPDDRRAGALPDRDKAIDAVVGLTADEAANCFAKSLVTTKRIDAALVTAEKRRVIAREKVLTWYEPDPRGFDSVGGLDVLKPWANARRAAYSPEARAYGLPSPKGVFLVGVPGCGKSQFAKALASGFGQPLLKLDMGALKSKFVGDSEANIRKALALAETVAPCVLWIDEIDKALAGSQGPQGDGGVSTDALGAILTWMQERTSPVFVVATANDVRGLPPELLRKGRFDEVFFVDLPTQRERMEIIRVALAQHGRKEVSIDLAAVATACAQFTGAECAAIVPEALFDSFADGAREITTADLVAKAKLITPLAETAKAKIADLREWAKGKARMASTPDSDNASNGGALDLD